MLQALLISMSSTPETIAGVRMWVLQVRVDIETSVVCWARRGSKTVSGFADHPWMVAAGVREWRDDVSLQPALWWRTLKARAVPGGGQVRAWCGDGRPTAHQPDG